MNAGVPPKEDRHHSVGLARPHHVKANGKVTALGPVPSPVKQPYDAFLILDVEATCIQGSGLNWPNELIASLVSFHSAW
jgi:hypothetical protein